MPLTPGSRLGPYEVLTAIGAGGMGEVYRARDSRLGRDVAVKVLPASFAENPERLRRFEQEARATGMLNHPNILAVYDVGTHEGAPYLVTELLEGQTLREEMPVTRRKALDYARQIATGLAAAHAKSVTHRDLKPENIFVTGDGRVKILDFGLAKVAADPDDVTRTAGTTPGLAMGTIGYMSPEQARGKGADARSDIFSFGAILYEMLSGQRAFHRDSAAESLSAILKEDPPPLPDAALEKIVRRCLEKSPEQRFQSASDLGFAIEALSGTTTTTAAAAVPVKGRNALWKVCAAAAVSLALGVAFGFWWQARRQAAAPEWNGVLLGGPDMAVNPRVSPNGQSLAFTTDVDSQLQVAVMNPNSRDWSVVTRERAKGYAWTSSWSSDSAKIYFDRISGNSFGVFVVPALGGEEQLVLEDAHNPEALPDGSLIVSRINAERKSQLHRFWPQTGRVEPLGAEGPFNIAIRLSPDGKDLVFFGRPLPSQKPDTSWHYYALDLASGQSRRLAPEIQIPLGYLTMNPTGQFALLTKGSGDLIKVVQVPLRGRSTERLVLDWGGAGGGIDAGADGSLYVNDFDRPMDVLRLSASGGVPERLAGGPLGNWTTQVLQFPDGRVVFPTQLSGRRRLLAARPGKDPHPFVQTEEDTNFPMALVGTSALAFRIGRMADPAGWMLAIASLSDGRIIRRLETTKGLDVSGLDVSPDGKTLYYTAAGSLWAIPAAGGQPRKLAAGDSVAADPNGIDVIVSRDEKDATHLFRVPVSGGSEQPIAFPKELRIARSLAAHAVHKDGRILVDIDSFDSGWERPAILDPKTGKVERVIVPYSGDVWQPVWTNDGRILAQGAQVRTALWRLRKENK